MDVVRMAIVRAEPGSSEHFLQLGDSVAPPQAGLISCSLVTV